jgi:hypothetical protein
MKRFFKAFRFAAILFGGLIAAGLIYYAVTNWRASARLEKTIARLRAAGEPIRLADLGRAPIPPEENAFTFLKRAEADIKAIENEVSAAETAELDAKRKREEEAGQTTAETANDDDVISPAVLAAMRTALAAYPKAVPLLLEASRCPDFDWQLDVNLAPRDFTAAMIDLFKPMRGGVRVLNYQAQIDLADGRADDALQSALAIMRLSRLLDREPTLVVSLVSLACFNVGVHAANDALRLGPISDASQQALEDELAQQLPIEAAKHTLKTERPFMLEHYRDFLADGVGWLPSMKNDACTSAELVDALLETLPLGTASTDPKVREILARSGPLTASLEPSFQAYLHAVRRQLATLRSLRILATLSRNKFSPEAAVPQLDELGLPASEIVDPFNGEPMRLKKLPEGWLIYSVGRDLKDDGGDVADKDVGLAPKRASPWFPSK